jgi:hypothetical protein
MSLGDVFGRGVSLAIGRGHDKPHHVRKPADALTEVLTAHSPERRTRLAAPLAKDKVDSPSGAFSLPVLRAAVQFVDASE